MHIDTGRLRSVICALAVQLFTCLGDRLVHNSRDGLSLFPKLTPLSLHVSQKLDLLKDFVGFLSLVLKFVVGNRLPI